MRAIQLGARMAPIVVPHLANSTLAQELKIAESTLKSLQKGIDFYTKENIDAMVEQTVSFLEDLNQRHEERGLSSQEPKTNKNQSTLNDAEVIEGVELKQLENFLSNADKERILGNLYRYVTKEGHVKWVCRTHIRQKPPRTSPEPTIRSGAGEQRNLRRTAGKSCHSGGNMDVGDHLKVGSRFPLHRWPLLFRSSQRLVQQWPPL